MWWGCGSTGWKDGSGLWLDEREGGGIRLELVRIVHEGERVTEGNETRESGYFSSNPLQRNHRL